MQFVAIINEWQYSLVAPGTPAAEIASDCANRGEEPRSTWAATHSFTVGPGRTMRNCARSVRGGPGGAFTDDLARFPAGPWTSHGSKSPRRGRHLRRSCTTSRWCTASMPSTRRHPSQKATDGAEPDPPSASSTGTTPATSTAGQTAPTPSATNAPRCAPPPASPIHKSCTETRSAASPAKARLGRFASDAHAGRRRGHDHATTAMRRGPGSSRRGTPPGLLAALVMPSAPRATGEAVAAGSVLIYGRQVY
ncbi:hypothetical protein SSPNP10_18705 [Streptomyces sp. NP10]|nr:hypothetical protein SSPNP10_18705 [Streptomyces sp. NP10]